MHVVKNITTGMKQKMPSKTNSFPNQPHDDSAEPQHVPLKTQCVHIRPKLFQ